jgi:hypothetical protein
MFRPSGAAQESNLPTHGLHALAGIEDRRPLAANRGSGRARNLAALGGAAIAGVDGAFGRSPCPKDTSKASSAAVSPVDSARRRARSSTHARYPDAGRSQCRRRPRGRVQSASKRLEIDPRRRLIEVPAGARNSSNQAGSYRFRSDAVRCPDFHRTQEVKGSNPLESIVLWDWASGPLGAIQASLDQGGCYSSSPRHEAVKGAERP